MSEPANAPARHVEQEGDDLIHGRSMNPSTDVSVSPGSNEKSNGPSATTRSVPLRQLYGQAVNSLTDIYVFAGDAAEHTRLDAQHGAITLTLGGLIPSEAEVVVQAALQLPNLQPAVLDIGTGSGAWAIDIAKQMPEADVLGCDLVPVNPGSQPPSNCRFEVCDVNVNLDSYPSDAFNIIHARAVLQGVKDYPSFFKQVERLLRPGGVFLSIEVVGAGFDEQKNRISATMPEDPGFTWFHRLATVWREATTARNPSLASVERVDEILRNMGDTVWSAVSNTSVFVPVGAWSSDPIEQRAGGLMRQSFLHVLFSARPLFLSRFSNEDVERLTAGLTAEMAESRVQQYMKLCCAWAVKQKAV